MFTYELMLSNTLVANMLLMANLTLGNLTTDIAINSVRQVWNQCRGALNLQSL